jgi:hypothetical protein
LDPKVARKWSFDYPRAYTATSRARHPALGGWRPVALECPEGRLTPDLAEEIAAHKPEIIQFIREVHAETEPLARISRDEPLQLSFAQERLWFLNRLQPDSTAYNITAVAPIRGPVDSATLEQAANVLAARHENLRTAFTHQDGRPVVLIVADLKFTIAFEDLAYLSERERAAQLDTLVQRETSQPFDLTCPPLFRITLVRLGSEQHSLSSLSTTSSPTPGRSAFSFRNSEKFTPL